MNEMIDPLLKTILEIEEILQAHMDTMNKRKAYGIFFRGLYIRPGITVEDVKKQYRLKKELELTSESFRILRQQILREIRVSAKYPNINIDRLDELEGAIDDTLNQIENMKKENITWLVELFEKTNG